MNRYAIADLHGQLDLLRQVKEYLHEDDILYILGDSGDRGPQPWATLKMSLDDPQFIYLMGNHDLMLLDAIDTVLKEGDEVYTNIDADEAVMAQNDWGDDVTSKRFTLNSAYLNGHTEVYYDVYAARYEGYTLVVSPYSNRVLVDLRNRTSEVIDDATAITSIKADARQAADDNWYDLTGRRVLNPGSGIYIHHGKKVVR